MILKTAQGRYRVKVKDRGVIVADRTFVRWNDAEHWEAEGKQKVARGQLAPASAGRIRLADVKAAWSQVRPGQVQARTWQSDQCAWACHLAARFGHMPVGSITSVDVHGFAVELRRDPPRRHVTLDPADLLAVWRMQRNHSDLADVTLFLALTDLRWGEAMKAAPDDQPT